MSTEKWNGPNICLGHLNSSEILYYAGFSVSCYKEESHTIPELSGKHIADFACGFSDLLSTILNVSMPLSVTAVDVIFQNSKTESEAEKLLSEYLQRYRKFYLAQFDSGEEKAYQTVLKLEERLKVLSDFSHKADIDYASSFTQRHFKKMDIIFINFFLYHFQNPEDFVMNIKRYLSPGGKIIIVDFDTLRRNFSSKILRTLRVEKSLFSGEITL